MNFCTLFLKTENVHLTKDVGQLPFCLKRDFGYNAYIATYRNGEYPYLLSEVQNLELQFVKKSILGKSYDGIRYLYKNRRNIDILNIYHLNFSSFIWVMFFKIIRKKKALIYLKLDADHLEIDKMKQKNIKAWIKHLTIRNADIVSAESRFMRDALQIYCKSKLLYIPNGCLEAQQNGNTNGKKENIILTVGRLGTYQKATEVLVNAFLKSDLTSGWQLVLIGSMTDDFREWMRHKLAEYQDVSESIMMLGSIESKEVLQKWYDRAKIFALPSRYEGFPIVLVEAMTRGCYIIVSDTVLAARDLICNQKMGSIVAVNSEEDLRQALQRAAYMEIDWDMNAKQIQSSIEDRFLWKNILKVLDSSIKSCMEGDVCKTRK